MPKISLEEIKKISPKSLLKLVQRANKFLKKNKVIKDLCKEYGVDVDIIDLIPVKFGDLDVSARTERGVITLNYKLLCDGDFLKDWQYLTHEYCHYLAQCFGNGPTQGADDGNYLENPDEQDAFQRQIEYLDDMYGEDEAENYVDHLLDHHDVKNTDDREEKKEKLMERVDG